MCPCVSVSTTSAVSASVSVYVCQTWTYVSPVQIRAYLPVQTRGYEREYAPTNASYSGSSRETAAGYPPLFSATDDRSATNGGTAAVYMLTFLARVLQCSCRMVR
eukprot:183351-Rhodomonas_salina.3